MSHLVSVDVEFDDLSALGGGCTSIGWEFLEGQTTYKYAGYWADDSPVPDGIWSPEQTATVRAMSHAERKAWMEAHLGRCEHAIRVPGANYEVGIVRKHNGKWTMLWDWWSAGGLLAPMGGQDGRVLKRAYAAERTKQWARRQGFRVQETKLAGGAVRLRLRK